MATTEQKLKAETGNVKKKGEREKKIISYQTEMAAETQGKTNNGHTI